MGSSTLTVNIHIYGISFYIMAKLKEEDGFIDRGKGVTSTFYHLNQILEPAVSSAIQGWKTETTHHVPVGLI